MSLKISKHYSWASSLNIRSRTCMVTGRCKSRANFSCSCKATHWLSAVSLSDVIVLKSNPTSVRATECKRWSCNIGSRWDKRGTKMGGNVQLTNDLMKTKCS